MDDPLSLIANILECIGFLVTIWTAFAVKKIRDRYTSLGMLPQVMERVETLAVELQGHLTGYTGEASVLTATLSRLEANLLELSELLLKNRRQPINDLVAQIRACNQPGKGSQDQFWAIYGHTYKVIELTKHVQEKSRWRA